MANKIVDKKINLSEAAKIMCSFCTHSFPESIKGSIKYHRNGGTCSSSFVHAVGKGKYVNCAASQLYLNEGFE